MGVTPYVPTVSPRKTGRRGERRLAAATGARLVPGSGSGRKKGDARLPGIFFEVKTTRQRQFTLTRDILDKLVAQAERLVPTLVIIFEESRQADIWVAMPFTAWQDLMRSTTGVPDKDTVEDLVKEALSHAQDHSES